MNVAARSPREPARTIFFGSGAFAVPILDALAGDPLVRLVGVVTVPDRPTGRRALPTHTPVARRATELGLSVVKPARLRDPATVAELEAFHPVLGILADYGRIVPPAVLAIPPGGILNVHPSLLPRHRGATPIPASIAAGDPTTGVTVIAMDAGLDTGPIVAQEAWPLTGTETTPDLEVAAALRGADLLGRIVGPWLTGQLVATPQDEAQASLTRPFRREDARLDPGRSAVDLERQVRARLPWPGTFFETDGGRVAVEAASVAPGQPGDVPGRVVAHDARPAIATGDGRLVLERVHPAGGRSMTGEAYLRGHPDAIGGDAGDRLVAGGDSGS